MQVAVNCQANKTKDSSSPAPGRRTPLHNAVTPLLKVRIIRASSFPTESQLQERHKGETQGLTKKWFAMSRSHPVSFSYPIPVSNV